MEFYEIHSKNQGVKICIVPLKRFSQLIPVSLRCKHFLFRILSFGFVFVMFALCEILGSCAHKFVLHLEDVSFSFYGLPRRLQRPRVQATKTSHFFVLDTKQCWIERISAAIVQFTERDLITSSGKSRKN